MPDLQRLQYDLTPLKTRPVPIIWMVGPPGSGRNTQAQALSENVGFENVKISELLKAENAKDTDRGRIIKESMHSRGRRVPDVSIKTNELI